MRKNIVLTISFMLFFLLCNFISAQNSPYGMAMMPWALFSTGQEVSGKDLPCVGKYDGMKRVMYNKSFSNGVYTTVLGYVKQGNCHDSAKDFFESKFKKCGYKLESMNEGSFATPTIKIIKNSMMVYTKGKEEVSLSIITTKDQANKVSTFVAINYKKE